MIVALALLGACRQQVQAPGLEAWRTLDRAGRACVSCHSPDGIELSAYGFDRRDLVRRAAIHLSPPLQKMVADMILANRRTLIQPPADPMTARPMQPGGKVLSGGSAESREAAFLTRLESAAPLLGGARVQSLAMATALRDEVLGLDLHRIPVGIEMNRLSEDGFHGREHATLAHWIPDVPVAIGPAVRSAEKAYLEAPSEQTLNELDRTVVASAPRKTPVQVLALAKYRSLLILQHELRTGKFAQLVDNPFWKVAELARTSETFSAAQLGLEGSLRAAKSQGPVFSAQMKQMRLPWFWLGWMQDPALRHSGERGETLRADYFTQTLLRDGPYPAHAVFMLLRKLCEQQRNPANRPFELQYSLLVLNAPLTQLEPKEPVARRRFRRIAGNAFRTTLFLVNDDLKKRGTCVVRESQLLQIRQIDKYLTAIGEPERTLIDETTRLLSEAKRFTP